MNHFRFLPLVLCLLPALTAPTAQTLVPATSDMRRNLADAIQTQTLESEGTPPFRIEATFETFNYQGKPDGDGTLVEEWPRPGVQRRVVVFRGVTWTQVSRGGKVRSSGDSFEGSFLERRVIHALFMPGPTLERLNETSASYKSMKVGTIPLDCVILAPTDVVLKSNQADKLPSGYCVSEKPRLIRLVEERYALVLTYNHFVRLGEHTVAEEVAIGQNGKPRAAIHVTSFKTMPLLKESDFVLPESTDSSNEIVSLPSGVVTGKLLKKVSPHYPDDAKYAHVSGSVVLAARIDKMGKIRKLEVLSTPSESLAKASLDVVRQWEYTPYLLNGEPVEVDTTITVNFNFTP